MTYNRALVPALYASKDDLSSDLVGIGILLASSSHRHPNIENTLVAASLEGMDGCDLRTLSLLVDWIAIHGDRINADRLTHLVSALESKRVRCFWAAIAAWRLKDRRMKKLRSLYRGPKLEVLSSGSDFLIGRDGEDPRFSGSPLAVAKKTLRHRPQDILTPSELAKRHPTYRWRLIIGPTYRADMWALVEDAPAISAAEIARRTYGSFATAWQVKKDWSLLKGKNRERGKYND